jgi:hypothetical protein
MADTQGSDNGFADLRGAVNPKNLIDFVRARKVTRRAP